MQLKEWQADSATVVLPVQDVFRNRSGVVHGGIIATMLDVAASCAGNYCTIPHHVRLSLTLSMDIVFCAAARGKQLVATGSQLNGGRSIWFAHAQVFDDTTLVASAHATFRYRSGSEHPEGVPLNTKSKP